MLTLALYINSWTLRDILDEPVYYDIVDEAEKLQSDRELRVLLAEVLKALLGRRVDGDQVEVVPVVEQLEFAFNSERI